MRFEIVSRLANGGTMVLAAIVIAMLLAFVFERSLLGALQWVTAFAFYLAVMVATIPLPAIVHRIRGHFHGSNALALLFALAYAGNALYIGRWQSVLMLAMGGAVVGIVVGFVALRREQTLLQHPG
jgi:hypothetical protein